MASGATVLVIGGVAVKVNGGHRLNEQAEWLMRYPSPGIVRVLGEWEGGYAMERLTTPPTIPTVDDVLRLLKENVWNRPPEVAPDWNAVEDYAIEKAKLYWHEVVTSLTERIKSCAARSLTRVRIHGDPTFENVMMRGREYVLIDPLPAVPHAPDLLAVDLGKLLQSSCGYEDVILGVDPQLTFTDWIDEFNEDERFAAITFGLIHVVRLLRYLPSDEMRHRMTETVGDCLFHL